MNEYLRRNNKKLLAIFGVFLMIAFIIPTFNRADRGGHTGDHGTMNGVTITGEEYEEAQRDLRLLTKTRAFGEFMLFELVVRNLSEDSYLLLLKEARQNNVGVTDEEVNEFLAQAPLPPPADGVEAEARRQALRNWMTVLASFNRVAGALRLSPALVEQVASFPRQSLSVALVEFPAERFLRDVPEPTEQQLQAFFEKHKGDSRAASESGVGYRFPNRVRLQWVMIPLKSREQAKGVLETITKEESAEYWLAHQDDFQTDPFAPDTQPASQPATTRSATNPATQAAAPTTTRPATLASSRPAPTTRPWAVGNDVDNEVRKLLANQRAAILTRSVQQLIGAEYPGWREHVRNLPPTTSPGPRGPMTPLGAAYDHYPFLFRVAERIQASRESRGVLPETYDVGELLDESQLRLRYPIGKNDRFREYLFRFLEPFVTPQDRRLASDNRIPIANVYEPIKLDPQFLRDDAGNVYIVRVTEASPAHAAPDLDAVREQAVRDWKNTQALDLARAAAKRFAEEARAKGDLAAAAKGDDALKVFLTGRFSPILFDATTPLPIPGYPALPDEARAQFIKGGTGLFEEFLKTGKPKPIGLVDVPRAQRIVVAQLQDAAGVSDFALILDREPARTRNALAQARMSRLMAQWFDPAAIAARLNYAPGKQDRSDKHQPAPADNAPRGPLQGL